MTTFFDNPLSKLRQLKGAPLSVFLACLWAHQVVSQSWCCEQTGYSDHAVTRALGYLTEHGFLAKVTGGWMPAQAVQIPLGAVLPSGEEANLDPENRDNRDFENKNREKRDFPFAYPLINVNSDSIDSSLIDSLTLTTSDENREKRDSSPGVPEWWEETAPGLSSGEVLERFKALNELGIFGDKAKEIAKDHHVTIDDMRAHVLLAKDEQWDSPLGMAIYRLLNHIPAPKLQANGHVVGCRCDECNINTSWKYTTSKFSSHLDTDDEEDAE